MELLNNLMFVTDHPLTRDRKLSALRRWLSWQIGSRLVPGPVAVPFVNDALLLMSPGMTGATGNLYTGLHEFEEMGFLLHLLREGDLFVDVGSNVGSYTVLASAVREAFSISMEPGPSAFEALRMNVAINNMAHKVECLNLAASSKSGRLSMTTGLDSANYIVPGSDHKGLFADVEAMALDELVGDRQPLLIKIDVEGFETSVIEGADHVMTAEGLCALIVEMNGYGRRYGFDESSLHRRLLSNGFSSCRYSPFERSLTESDSAKTPSGNVIYVRNIVAVMNRLKSARPFRVLGRHI